MLCESWFEFMIVCLCDLRDIEILAIRNESGCEDMNKERTVGSRMASTKKLIISLSASTLVRADLLRPISLSTRPFCALACSSRSRKAFSVRVFRSDSAFGIGAEAECAMLAGDPGSCVRDKSDPDDSAVKNVLKSSSRRDEEPTAS